MPSDPAREIEIKRQIEQEFAEMESASEECQIGVLDVLQVYGGIENAAREADAYLDLLNPTFAVLSTTSTSNVQE